MQVKYIVYTTINYDIERTIVVANIKQELEYHHFPCSVDKSATVCCSWKNLRKPGESIPFNNKMALYHRNTFRISGPLSRGTMDPH